MFMLQGVAVTSAEEEAPSVPTHLPGDLVFLTKVPPPPPRPSDPANDIQGMGRKPTKFTKEPEEARRTLTEGGVGTQASASVPALAVIGDPCVGTREKLPWAKASLS